MIMYTPVIKYEYEGKIKKHTSNIRSYPKPYEKGDTVTILIDREDSTKVLIKSNSSLYLGSTVFMIFTLPFLIIAFLAVSISYALMRLSKD